jgi:hypothetical protein
VGLVVVVAEASLAKERAKTRARNAFTSNLYI